MRPSVAKLCRFMPWAALLLAAVPATAANRAPTKQEGEVKPDSALVYLVREGHFQGSGRTMFVYSDDSFVGTLDNDCYTFAQLPPGKHLLWLNWARINAEVELEAGKTYYYNVWDQVRPVEESFGKALLGGVKGYCTPAPKEQETAAEHIRERYGEAQQRAAKKPAGAPPEHTADKKREENVARWPKVDLASYGTLFVEDFPMADPKAAERKKGYLVESAPQRLADMVAKNVGTAAFAEVVRGTPPEAREGAVILRAKITQYKPGSETARLMIAGAGSAQLEMAAELVDAASAKSLVQLPIDRTWAWGGILGASRGIEDMERNVAYELGLYLQRSRGVTAARPAPTPAPAPAPAEQR
jgi:hypothetical protein